MGKPRVLVLGGSGCLGSALVSNLLESGNEVVATSTRDTESKEVRFYRFRVGESLDNLIGTVYPQVIVNCIVVKSSAKENRKSLDLMIRINSIFPRHLARVANNYGAKVIHISTDSVFFGSHKLYKENSITVPRGKYAWSKLIGEPRQSNLLNIRLSFVPQSAETVLKHNLFRNLRNSSIINPQIAFTNCFWNGLTDEFAGRGITSIVNDSRIFDSLWPVAHFFSRSAISRFELYEFLVREYGFKNTYLYAKEKLLPYSFVLSSVDDSDPLQIWKSIGYQDIPDFYALFANQKNSL